MVVGGRDASRGFDGRSGASARVRSTLRGAFVQFWRKTSIGAMASVGRVAGTRKAICTPCFSVTLACGTVAARTSGSRPLERRMPRSNRTPVPNAVAQTRASATSVGAGRTKTIEVDHWTSPHTPPAMTSTHAKA